MKDNSDGTVGSFNPGDYVVHIPSHLFDGPIGDMILMENLGQVKSKNEKFVFVRYHGGDTAAATNPKELFRCYHRSDLCTLIDHKLSGGPWIPGPLPGPISIPVSVTKARLDRMEEAGNQASGAMFDLGKVLSDQEEEKALDWIVNRKIRAKFWHGKHHTFAILWYQFSFEIGYSYDNDDEQPNCISICLGIFSLTIDW